MSALGSLLEVQDRDTAADQLRHRRAHLPERTELATLERRMAALDERLAEAESRRNVVLERQSRLEATIAATDRRLKEVDGRLYSGEVTATRDIMAMTAEIESLKSRCSSLEDEVLAAMEEDEPLAAEVGALEQERASLEADATRVRQVIAEAEAAIDAELAAVLGERAQRASGVPESLLATYEKLRARLGGVGAARLVGASCSGCHLVLPAQELDRLKREPPDTVVLCDQCGRILVR